MSLGLMSVRLGRFVMNVCGNILFATVVSIVITTHTCDGQQTAVSYQFQKIPDPEVSASESYQELNSYIAKLEALRELWRRAVRLTIDGDIQQAYDLISKQSPLPESNTWCSRSIEPGKHLRAIERGSPNSYSEEGVRGLICLDCPQEAIEYLERLRQERGELEFSYAIHLAQAFLETGEDQKAGELLESLVTEKTSDDWKDRLNARIAKIDDLATAVGHERLCASVFREDFNWCRKRLSPIIWTWQCGQDLEHLNILASLFKDADDNYGHNLVLKIMAEAEVPGISKSVSADAILELGNKAHKAKNYEQAFELWRQVEDNYRDTPAWGKAAFNTGIALKEQQKFNDAIKQFKKLLSSNVNDKEPGAHIMQAYRNYRPQAQWEIANCLLSKGEYSDALTAYQASQTKYPFQSWCGTCSASYEGRYALYQGLCLEHLGRYDEAVKAYFSTLTQELSFNSTISIRIADLYQSCNQIEALMQLLDEVDAYRIRKLIKEHGRQKIESWDVDKHSRTRIIRRIIEIRQLGKEGNVSALAELVAAKSREVSPFRYRDRVSHWEAIEATEVLAQHPDKAVPLLKKKMFGNNRDKLIHYALALCKTEEAAKILKEAAKNAKNSWQILSLEYAMTLLDKTDLPSEANEGIYFPALPTKISLPKKLSEIDDDVAFEESIPKSMTLDLSKPQATVKSLFTAALIGEKNLYEKCIYENPELSRGYEDIAESSRKRTFKYEQTASVFTSDDTAEISVEIADDRSTGKVVFILSRMNRQWLITDFKETRSK